MKDLLLCVHVVVKTFNMEISRCHLADYVKEFYCSACRTCSTIIFSHSTNQIIVFWRRHCRCGRPCLSSVINFHSSLSNQSTKVQHSDLVSYGVERMANWCKFCSKTEFSQLNSFIWLKLAYACFSSLAIRD